MDAEATWSFRRLPSVDPWIRNRFATLHEYRANFADPVRLAKTLVIEHHGAVIDDLMLAIKDAWAQADVQEQAREVKAELG